VSKSRFRVKRYKHGKYKFLVRGKVLGRWRRRYFVTEAEAIAFSEQQNASAQQAKDDASSTQGKGARKVKELRFPWFAVRPQPERSGSPRDFSKLDFPTYAGPRIKRYLGDSWCMHLPFAYDLMRELAPKVFVELGVKQGESYFSFCQSAAENKINVQCYGVDSWLGDIQTGNLDPEMRQEVADYNLQYSSFSGLKRMLFAEAVKDFPDATIDLLHIDGTHTYADVKTDFESWLPKLSLNGIVLFHDVMVRGHGFGVWKLWKEITREHDSFLFEFGCGLGVWKRETVAPSDSAFIRRLLGADKTAIRDIHEHYANAAAALALWPSLQRLWGAESQLAQFKTEAEEKTQKVVHFQREAEEKAKHVAQLQREAGEKSQQVIHFQREAEEKAKHAAQLQRDLEETSRQVARLQRDLKEKSSLVAHFHRQHDQILLDRLQGLIRDSERMNNAR